MADTHLIDWARPWLAPLVPQRLALEGEPARTLLSQRAHERALVSGQGMPLSFVSADDAGQTPYEQHIARTGRVPTRDNLHDLFNAAVWLTLPRLKAVLNARQAQCLAVAGSTPSQRGGQRDAATLFDESGMLIAVAADAAPRFSAVELQARIAAHDWTALFCADRGRWHQHWAPWLVGHAVMEKLVRPYPAITVRVRVVALEQGDIHNADEVDAAAARAFAQDPAWSSAALPPMPILGIPGWWPANEAPDFYANPHVFRPPRTSPS